MSSAVLKFLVGPGKTALEIGAADVVVGGAALETDTGKRVKNAVLAALELDEPGRPPVVGSASAPTPPLLPPPVGGTPHVGCACQNKGAAPVGGGAPPPGTRFACPSCPPVVAGAGDSVQVRRCDKHEADVVEAATKLDGFYLGWAEANGVNPEVGYTDCGPKPQQTDKQFRTYWGNLDVDTYYPALDRWKDCTIRAKAKDVSTAQKVKQELKSAWTKGKTKEHDVLRRASDFALAAQKTKYETQIANLQQQQRDAQTAADKAALQKQIDTMTQQKADTDKLIAQTQQQAQNDQHRQEIEQLQREIAANAQKPGGMDDMMKMVMAARLFPGQTPPSAASQAATGPMMPSMQPQAPNVTVNIPPQSQDGASGGGRGDGGGGPQVPMVNPGADEFDLSGHDDDPFDPELARALGIEGVPTLGDARTLYSLRNELGGFAPDEFEQLRLAYVGASSGVGSCTTGCGVSFPQGR